MGAEIIYVGDDHDSWQWLENVLRATTTPSAFDTETKGWKAGEEHPKGKAFATCATIATDEFPHIYVDNYGPCTGNFNRLKWWFESDKPKVAHNSIFDHHVLANHGMKLEGLVGDTIVMDYLEDTSREGRHQLEKIVEDRFGEKLPDYADSFGWYPPKKDGTPQKRLVVRPHHEWWEMGETHRVMQYAVKDTRETLRLFHHLKRALEGMVWYGHHNYWEYYQKFALPFTGVLFRMERRGVAVDMDWLADCRELYTLESEEEGRKFYAALADAGVSWDELENFNDGKKKPDERRFNPGSGQQLARLIYERLGYEVSKTTDTGAASTDAEVLNALAEGGCVPVSHLVGRRMVEKLIGTYVDPLLEWAPQYGGRIHTTIRQIGTVTGRLSSALPNLQNVPIRTELGALLRGAFVASPGYDMVDGDLSQIEVRIAAHRSQDEVMLWLVRNDYDFHSMSAFSLDPEVQIRTLANFGKFPDGRPTPAALKWIKAQFPNERARAKNTNFAIQYGAGAPRLASTYGCDLATAERMYRAYFETYHGMKRYIENQHKKAAARGYVQTLLNRYCHLPHAQGNNWRMRKAAERQSVNYDIQGSAADVIMMAMLLIDQHPRLNQLGYQMLLQIHDEILGETPKGTGKEVKKIVEELMGNPYPHFGVRPLSVATPAAVAIGRSWASAH